MTTKKTLRQNKLIRIHPYESSILKGLLKSWQKQCWRLTRDNFVESVNYDRTDVVKESLVESIRPFDEDVDLDNVGKVLFELLKKSLEFIVNPELENERRLNHAKSASRQAKGSFGAALLADCAHICSMTGCGKSLQIEDDARNSIDDYEAARIDGSKNIVYKSFIALS